MSSWFLSYLFLCGAVPWVLGSSITFSNSTSSIQPLLTSSLSLRCGANDSVTSSPSGSLVGRSAPAESMVSRSNVAADIEYVSSVIITRDGVDIAMVTEHTAARDILVSGQVTHKPGERGFLEISWQYPTASEAGQYMCEISGVTETGHSVVLTSSLEIGVTTPSIDDVVSQFHKRLQEINAQLVSQGQECQKDISDLKAQLVSQSQKCQKDISDLKNQMAHIEHSTVGLGDSANWPASGGRHAIRQTVTFSKPYPKPPVVFLSTWNLWFKSSVNGFYGLKLVSVDTAGFVLEVDGGSISDRLHGYQVGWISFPQ